MAIQLGDTAPDFTPETTEGCIGLHEYPSGDWGLLFSHPADLNPGVRHRARRVRAMHGRRSHDERSLPSALQ